MRAEEGPQQQARPCLTLGPVPVWRLLGVRMKSPHIQHREGPGLSCRVTRAWELGPGEAQDPGFSLESYPGVSPKAWMQPAKEKE